MMGFLPYTEDDELGALNIYSRRPGASTDWLLASRAPVALSTARTYAQMEHAIATRHAVGEATGILMGSHDLTEQQAFDVLRRHSQAINIKLREVARQICEHGSPT
ncbi:MAG: ANTAR domain-containing protein [Streptomyces sp.]|nr:ANTAR domain-containing protein [Streptomyces sp.]